MKKHHEKNLSWNVLLSKMYRITNHHEEWISLTLLTAQMCYRWSFFQSWIYVQETCVSFSPKRFKTFFTLLPFAIFSRPFDDNIIWQDWSQLAMASNVDGLRRSFRFDSRFVGRNRIGKLNEFAIDHDVNVRWELVRDLFVRFKREGTESELNLKRKIKTYFKEKSYTWRPNTLN